MRCVHRGHTKAYKKWGICVALKCQPKIAINSKRKKWDQDGDQRIRSSRLPLLSQFKSILGYK